MKKTSTDVYCCMSSQHIHDFKTLMFPDKHIETKCKWCDYIKKDEMTLSENRAIEIKKGLPLISILMPVFCREKLLRYGLQSLSKQTSKYPFEILVLNDGIEDNTRSICQEYKNKLNIRYIFTGSRNDKVDIPIWRCPSYAMNIGAKLAKGDILLLTCPEIYHIDPFTIEKVVTPVVENPKLIGTPIGLDDQTDIFEKYIQTHSNIVIDEVLQLKMKLLHTTLPFFMAIDKKVFFDIGGYDEELTGICFDDDDLIGRLQAYGCAYKQVDTTIVHLYHVRGNSKSEDYMNLWRYNQRIYLNKKGQIIRNIGKEWGTLTFSASKDTWFLKNIPKKAHFYWGNKTLPFLRYLTIYSFYKFNPDWEINVYYPKKVFDKQTWGGIENKYEHTGADCWDDLKKLPINFIEFDMNSLGVNNDISEVFKSEYLKNYLLTTYGGVWSDMDIIYFRPMTKISVNTELNAETTNIVSIDNRMGNRWFHSIGFLLASSNNEYHNFFFEQGKSKFDPSSYQSIGALLFNKYCPTIDIIHTIFKNTKAVNMDYNTVYAYGYITRKLPMIFGSNDMCHYTNSSIGLHWYGGIPESEKWLNTLTYDNYKNYDNVLCKTIGLVYD